MRGEALSVFFLLLVLVIDGRRGAKKKKLQEGKREGGYFQKALPVSCLLVGCGLLTRVNDLVEEDQDQDQDHEAEKKI